MRSRFAVVVALAPVLLFAGSALAHFGPYPIGLEGVPLPPVPGLVDGPDPIVVDEAAAIALGKALFWDQNVGSDGVACASCHFHAGADVRVKNQRAPTGKGSLADPSHFDVGPNAQLARDDFPFHQTDDPLSPLGRVVRTSDDVVSSSGSFGGDFLSVAESGASADVCERSADPVFHVGAVGTRRVEPRNAPTVINAAFLFRTLWDGKANNVFNGSSAFGERDPGAGVWVATPYGVVRQRLHLPNSSLASQALAPPLDDVEMSCNARRFADLGRKLACRRPLETQAVHPDDSVLGPLARSTPGQLRPGLDASYAELIRAAFAPRFWSEDAQPAFGSSADGAPYSQLEANFALFFGLSLQLYQATLVSDQSPFDRSRRDGNGIPIDLSPSAQNGFTAFRVAHCNTCHLGPLLTSAAIVPNAELVKRNPLVFGNETYTVSTTRNVVTRIPVAGDAAPGPVLIDTGFASNGVARVAWDVGLGGLDPFGNPLSFSEQWLQHLAGNAAGVVDPYVGEVRACDLDVPIARDRTQASPSYFTLADGIQPQPQGTDGCFNPFGAWIPTPAAAAAELADPANRHMRSAAVGSFKIPTLRNVELTGPYMHNGSMATLEEVVAFYTRGGNFEEFPLHFGTVFPQPELFASAQARADVVAFLESLTDERVRFERAPFDHPELRVPHGHAGDASVVSGGHALGADLALDRVLVIPAVGAAGRQDPLLPFDAVLDACAGDGCAEAVALIGPAAPPLDPEVCAAPEPGGALFAALATIAALASCGRRRVVELR